MPPLRAHKPRRQDKFAMFQARAEQMDERATAPFWATFRDVAQRWASDGGTSGETTIRVARHSSILRIRYVS
jgi:hypothetical protein